MVNERDLLIKEHNDSIYLIETVKYELSTKYYEMWVGGSIDFDAVDEICQRILNYEIRIGQIQARLTEIENEEKARVEAARLAALEAEKQAQLAREREMAEQQARVAEQERLRQEQIRKQAELAQKSLAAAQAQQPVPPVQPIQPAQPNQPVQPIQPVQPVQPIQPVQPAQPAQEAEKVCSCGQKNNAKALFCVSCGKKLS